MRTIIPVTILAAMLCGCGGQYILTAPDQYAPAGGEAEAVLRLERNDFFVLSLPVKELPLRMWVDDGPQRAAYTDKLGYFAAAVPVPDSPGRYTLQVHLQDREGEELSGSAPVYVWDESVEVVAVELAALPMSGDAAAAAASAMTRLGEDARFAYMTREPVSVHDRLHEQLTAAGYPDGPILLWEREYWHWVHEEWWKAPRIVVESRLVSQIGSMKRTFANLRTGVCRSTLAAKAFAGQGLRIVIVDAAGVTPDAGAGEVVHVSSWSDLPAVWGE